MQTSKEMLPSKIFTRLFPILFLIICSGICIDSGAQSIYSTNQAINVAHNKTITYCIGDPVDLIVGYHNHQDFAGPGIDNDVPNDGRAFFDPAAAGIGTWTISYHGSVWFFAVTADPPPPCSSAISRLLHLQSGIHSYRRKSC